MIRGASRNRTASSETHRNPAVRLRQPRFLSIAKARKLVHASPFEVEAIECFKALHLRAFPTAATASSAETNYY